MRTIEEIYKLFLVIASLAMNKGAKRIKSVKTLRALRR